MLSTVSSALVLDPPPAFAVRAADTAADADGRSFQNGSQSLPPVSPYSSPHQLAAAAIPPPQPDEKADFSRITSRLEIDMRSARKPKWPRDIPWTVAFFLVVPFLLLYPVLRGGPATDSPLARHPLSFASLHAITWSVAAVALVSRWLYRSAAGGEGDGPRARAASRLATAAPCSVLVYAALTATLWLACPTARGAAVLAAFYTARDVYSFRRWTRRTPHIGAGYASRIAFFQAVMSMALDILSRSLRRASLYRALTAILLLQLLVLLLWRAALLRAMASGASWTLLLATFMAGKWATATIMRVLTLLATAGVMNWCSEQAVLLSEMPPTNPRFRGANGIGIDNDNNGEYGHENGVGGDDEDGGSSSSNGIPEAYRTVDASVYQSVLGMEDVLDDDYDDLDEEVLREGTPTDRQQQATPSRPTGSNRRDSRLWSPDGQPVQHQPRATVKSILWTGVSINFGAIAHCALLGGLAQFIWSQVRTVEAARTAMSHARGGGGGAGVGFQGMQIGHAGSSGGVIHTLWNKVNTAARGFVRHHSDLAMTHVAAYYKGYVRAARDVATIIDESGAFRVRSLFRWFFLYAVNDTHCPTCIYFYFMWPTGLEPILHEDITTHMCTCVGGSISGVIVLITTYLLLHQRKGHAEVGDFHVAESMLISFVLSYTMIFTALEPLRAAIKASYVSYAQNPRCLSQAYPLIYHRLSRLSESQLS